MNGVPTGNGSFVADVGDIVEFDIVVTNDASSILAATGVDVVDTLPTGMSFTSASDGGTEDPTGTVTWTIASIDPDDSVTLDLFVTITADAAGQDVFNEVSVSGNENDPTPGNDDARSVPPVTVTADLSGTKFHDRDADGTEDPTKEEVLAGWTITAFDGSGTGTDAVTATDGTYTIQNLEPGTYTICEETNFAGLLPPGDGFVWSWTQSSPSANTLCDGFDDYESSGYTVEVDDVITGIDFGNHTQVSIDCSDGDVVVILGGSGLDDNPLSTVTVPQGTPSCSGGNVWTTTYDVGRSDPLQDPDPWSQFVIFGDEDAPDIDSRVMTHVIVWDAEPADYQGGSLVVPTTNVLLPGGTAQVAIELCDGSDPTIAIPVCLYSRTIGEGGALPSDFIQVTDDNRLLGDPGYFR